MTKKDTQLLSLQKVEHVTAYSHSPITGKASQKAKGVKIYQYTLSFELKNPHNSQSCSNMF